MPTGRSLAVLCWLREALPCFAFISYFQKPLPKGEQHEPEWQKAPSLSMLTTAQSCSQSRWITELLAEK